MTAVLFFVFNLVFVPYKDKCFSLKQLSYWSTYFSCLLTLTLHIINQIKWLSIFRWPRPSMPPVIKLESKVKTSMLTRSNSSIQLKTLGSISVIITFCHIHFQPQWAPEYGMRTTRHVYLIQTKWRQTPFCSDQIMAVIPFPIQPSSSPTPNTWVWDGIPLGCPQKCK